MPHSGSDLLLTGQPGRAFTITTITVLDAGTMGHGIAHAAMAGGFDTRLGYGKAGRLGRKVGKGVCEY